MNLLTINAGSSSLKYKVFAANNQLNPLLSGLIEGIGEEEGLWHHYKTTKESQKHHFPNHEKAFFAMAAKLKEDLANHLIEAVGHRVVHGGEKYYQPTLITAEVLAAIWQLAQLAPIHNPINALGIQFAQQHFPEAKHIAVFDTGFHHTIPVHAHLYAIDSAVSERYQIRRYGFHGINHQYVAEQAAVYLAKPLNQCNFITLHLGNGASACLIKEGQSVDTSMGMTPLAGLIMGTRCGDIDPAIVLYLQQQGLSASDVDNLLNKQSGLKGIAKENDMRKLITRALAGDKKAELALEMYVYVIQKMIGAYYSQTTCLDALVFTGGVGENAALIREKIIQLLKHLGLELNVALNQNLASKNCQNISQNGIPILVIRGDEEAFIAKCVYQELRF